MAISLDTTLGKEDLIKESLRKAAEKKPFKEDIIVVRLEDKKMKAERNYRFDGLGIYRLVSDTSLDGARELRYRYIPY